MGIVIVKPVAFHLQERNCQLENHHLQGSINASKLCQSWKERIGQLLLTYGTILYFWFEVTPVKTVYSQRSQVHSGAVKRAEHFSSIFSDGSYI